MKLTKEQIEQYRKEGFLVEKVKDIIKEMELIPKEELLRSQKLCLSLLYSQNPEEYSISKIIPFDKAHEEINAFLKKLEEYKQRWKKEIQFTCRANYPQNTYF